MSALPGLSSSFSKAIELIDLAHAQDPNTVTAGSGSGSVPYELHYAQEMTRWLAVRKPDASPLLQVACRAQHFRRWEIPRQTFPLHRGGYLRWRTKLKVQAAQQVAELLTDPAIDPPLSPAEIDRVAALIRKENLGGDAETQVLEDVACLVFLDDQFDNFEKKPGMYEEKIVVILKKTWLKMSEEGRELALQMDMSERARGLLGRALGSDQTDYGIDVGVAIDYLSLP